MKLACCLCVRNCAQYLPDIFANLETLGDITIIFVYDNCTDGSEIILNRYAIHTRNKVHIKHIVNDSPYRTVRIAKARNACLDILDTLDVDFHIMLDADDVNVHKWNIDIHKYLAMDTWDSVSFNRPDYYDIWALFYDKYKHHCYGYGLHYDNRAIIDFMQADIQRRLAALPDGELFECLSAFNGFAIYRTPVFRGIRYDGLYQNIRQFFTDADRAESLLAVKHLNPILNERFILHCEHVYYHLMANARIRISKEML